jgi:hypothetical protein
MNKYRETMQVNAKTQRYPATFNSFCNGCAAFGSLITIADFCKMSAPFLLTQYGFMLRVLHVFQTISYLIYTCQNGYYDLSISGKFPFSHARNTNSLPYKPIFYVNPAPPSHNLFFTNANMCANLPKYCDAAPLYKKSRGYNLTRSDFQIS